MINRNAINKITALNTTVIRGRQRTAGSTSLMLIPTKAKVGQVAKKVDTTT